MKKVYSKPEIETFVMNVTRICDVSDPDNVPMGSGPANGSDAGARRRSFLDGNDDVDWDLGF